MKKALLLCLILGMALSGFTQKKPSITTDQKNITKQLTYQPPYADMGSYDYPINPAYSNPLNTKDEAQLGTSWYDLQSNSALSNRLWLHPDGTLSAVWTLSLDQTSAFSDRGTGYNYFDGTTWGPEPEERIDSDRTGWPSIAAFGENGEIAVAHISGGSSGMDGQLFNHRPNKGTGDWTEFLLEGPDADHPLIYWPRMVTSGETNNVIQHLTVTAPVLNGGAIYQGQDGALLYSRSDDGGASWDPQFEILEGVGIDNYLTISADDYVWAQPRGETIAFVVSNTWDNDLFIMKSEDNGDTWEKTIIWEHPYPFYDWNTTIFTDSLWAPDGAASIAIDNDGMVHVVFGICRVLHDVVGTNYTLWPFAEGIGYWNESMPPFENENPHHALNIWDGVLVEDENLIGWMQDVDGDDQVTLLEEVYYYRTIGLCSMPTICIDNSNIIYTAWAGTTETYDDGTYNFRHIWTRRSPDNGTTWGNFYDLDTALVHIFDECVYPVFSGDVNENVHMIYVTDNFVGQALSDPPDHDPTENLITYFTAPVTFYTGINSPEVKPFFEVSQNFPNPATGNTVVKVDLERSADLSLKVSNLVGQEVLLISKGEVNGGTHLFSIGLDGLTPGVYFYTVKANETSNTRKMIVD
jgi:hypothetical protein